MRDALASIRAAAKGAMRTRPLLSAFAIVCLVCLLMVLTIDPIVAEWAGAQDKPTRKFWKKVTEWGEAGRYIVLGLVVFLTARILYLQALPNRMAWLYSRIASWALYLLVTMAVSGAVIHTLKFSMARLRPPHLIKDDLYGFFYYGAEYTNNSFPSGHTQTVFNVAMVLTLAFPKAGYVLLPLAGVLAFSRIMVTAHYPSDLVMGATIAILAAILVKRRWFPGLDTPVYPDAVSRARA